MRKSKFNETQIVEILKEAEAGVAVADLLRKHGVSKGVRGTTNMSTACTARCG